MNTNPNGKETKTIGSVLKAIDILQLVARSRDGLGVTEISQRLGSGVSATYHLLSTLKLRHMIEQDKSTKKYRIGFGFFQISSLASGQNILGNLSSVYLDRLSSTVDETSNLVILDHDEIEYLAQSESSQLLKMFTRPGARVPFYCTGGGKILFAHRSREQQEEILQRTEFCAYTPYTLTSPEALMQEVSRVLAQGYALDNEEREVGVTCIAAPVFDAYKDAVAALSISGPTYRLREKGMDRLAELLLKTAAEFSANLGYER